MKTAMQELIDDLKELKKDSKERNQDTSFDIGMTFAIARAELRLEKEKEQSIELIKQTAMFMAAAPLDEEIAKMSYEDIYNSYYNETYNQNK
jgi:hypothetical protein